MTTTLLGLDKYKGEARQYAIKLGADNSPQTVVNVSITSTWLKRTDVWSFTSYYQAAEFVERMNDSMYFLARICKQPNHY